MSKAAIITELKAWITPSLIVLVGFLAKSKFEDIETQLAILRDIQTGHAVLKQRVDYIESGLYKLEGRFNTHVRIDEAKNEEEITLKKLTK